MTNTPLLGRLSAQPAGLGTSPTDEMIALINERVQPPQPLRPDQVHVRSLRLVSDDVNDHGGRFPAEEHERLCELIVDSPVLIGHDRSRLPVARNFAARRVSDADRQWVQVWFYWMRGPQGDRLAADIDGGVVKEGSIGFEFRLPRCSICGEDIRRCDHIPGRQYADDTGVTQVAHYEYRDIIRVLETSLVYRGATPGTRLGNDPVFCKTTSQECFDRPQDEESLDVEEGTVGVVLDRKPLSSGSVRYVIARRDSADPSVCDEIVAMTPNRFDIGDHVRLNQGNWVRHNLASIATANGPSRMDVRFYICGRPCVPECSAAPALHVHIRSTRNHQ